MDSKLGILSDTYESLDMSKQIKKNSQNINEETNYGSIPTKLIITFNCMYINHSININNATHDHKGFHGSGTKIGKKRQARCFSKNKIIDFIPFILQWN